ncbi:hypothetical protein J542_0831 [Acinetobacter baumannii 299505]|nr:hypothetical protein J542_0831 [Acinetobacter baumannii 299505]
MNFSFLNGVCRHERSMYVRAVLEDFLNGVCRHELFPSSSKGEHYF